MIQGQLLRRSEHREVAIYLRDGSMWIADFIDGQGTLVEVNTWFRFNCGTPANLQAVRRTKLESALPLSQELAEQIEPLHRAAGDLLSRNPNDKIDAPVSPPRECKPDQGIGDECNFD